MGLKDLFENLLEKSVIDYVIGVLVGLDSNGRKNRGGTAFEYACEPIIAEVCKKYDISMTSQKQFKVLKDYGFEVSPDVANRKADFILVKDNKVLNIEVDYFFRGGSKPEEIIEIIKGNDGFQQLNNVIDIPYHGKVEFDHFCYINLPQKEGTSKRIYLDVEIQNGENPGYALLTRGNDYLSRMITSQNGKEYDYRNYDGMKNMDTATGS